MVKLKIAGNILKWAQPVVGKISSPPGAATNNSTGDDQQPASGNARSILGAHQSPGAVGQQQQHPNHQSANNNNNKRWIHNDALLAAGHVAYLVKFLGSVEVEQPKGLEVVKESIKKLEFQEHLRRSEGERIPRVELTISIDGVAIREPKTKQNIHQFPLHRISYCADDKSDRKYLSFITKTQQEPSQQHQCYVFVSDKLSEEITLTIGQAFELAYRKFLDAPGSDFDTKKELVQARKKIQELERKVSRLEQKLGESSEQRNHHTNKQPPTSQPMQPATNTNKPTSQHQRLLEAVKIRRISQGSESDCRSSHNNTSHSSASATVDLTLATSKLQSLIDLP